MKPHRTVPARARRDIDRLNWLAHGLANASSRIEDAYWEQQILDLVDTLLSRGDEATLITVLDQLAERDSRVYDTLVDLVESASQSLRVETPDGPRQVLLIALPVLAWSHYRLPTGRLAPAIMAALKAQLAGHVLAGDIRLALADCLFSPDQLPTGYTETRAQLTQLVQALLENHDASIDLRQLPETTPFIADVRYVLAAIMVTSGSPLFRWNEMDGTVETSTQRWQAQAGPSLQQALPGCTIELLQPDAYFPAWRRADRENRRFSLLASTAYLSNRLNMTTQALRAVIAPYTDRQQIVEWRIGLSRSTPADARLVLHGIVWPLLGAEDENTDIGEQIRRILIEEGGLGEVHVLGQPLPVEYCDDCGAPLFPALEGESVHAEMPEPSDAPPLHLH
jgi:hypothetical protein